MRGRLVPNPCYRNLVSISHRCLRLATLSPLSQWGYPRLRIHVLLIPLILFPCYFSLFHMILLGLL
jgi:hypothetical protein